MRRVAEWNRRGGNRALTGGPGGTQDIRIPQHGLQRNAVSMNSPL